MTHLAIFGSRARGDHRPDSDLDLLIEVEPGRKFSLVDLVRVQHAVGDELGVEANAMMRRSFSDRFRTSVMDDVHDVF